MKHDVFHAHNTNDLLDSFKVHAYIEQVMIEAESYVHTVFSSQVRQSSCDTR